MNRPSFNEIESLLEHMGAEECKEEVKHRYALRRKLLCSRFSFSSRFVRNRLYVWTLPLLTGGFVVMVLFSAVTTSSISDSSVLLDSPAVAADVAQVAADVVPAFSTDGLVAQFVDDRPMIPVTHFGNVVPFSFASAVFVQ